MDIIEDQVREQGAVVLVRNKGSAIWKDTSVKALLRHAQLKYIDVGELSVVIYSRCVAASKWERVWQELLKSWDTR